MGSVESTKSSAKLTSDPCTTRKVLPAFLKSAANALVKVEREVEQERRESATDIEPSQAQSFASGAYNDIWLITLREDQELRDPVTGAEHQEHSPRQFILRIPKEDSLLPDQIRNEVAFLTYVKQHLPSIPVPAVYAFETGETNPGATPFIAMEYVAGDQLSSVWETYSEDQKQCACRQLSAITFSLAETTFPGIGGMRLDHTLGPTIEGSKIFKGRNKFHSRACYNIGPYNSTKEYAVSYYDKEIYYYTHASDADIDWDLFDTVSKDDFVKLIQKKRQEVSEDDAAFTPEQPFVLSHGDLHARNIIVRDGKVAALLDWEFAGAYPLSEFFGGGGIDVTIAEDDASEEENARWSRRIMQMIEEGGKNRGWEERDLELLLGDGDDALYDAIAELFPHD